MLLARTVGMLVGLGIGASLVLWILTGQARYKTWAWNLFHIALVAAFIILALFALERLLIAV